ncbi:MAG: dihydropteroate synthase, partial [Candidatus Dormibacteraceae bacterium]
GLAMAAAGAHIIDVGGESTRPGHSPINSAEEIERVLPVVTELATRGVFVSIDTSKAEVAEAALCAGARMVNDVWGLQRSPELANLAATYHADLVITHNQVGTLYTGDLIEVIADRLLETTLEAIQRGVSPEKIILDPGIGFGKSAEHNLIVFQRLPELCRLGYPLLVGASRKSFLGRLFGQEMRQRSWGTAAVVAICIVRGAQIIRVHDVPEMMAVAQVAAALRN